MHTRRLIAAVAGELGVASAGSVVTPLLVPTAAVAGANTAAPGYTVAASGTGLKLAVGGATLVGGTSKVAANCSAVNAEGVGEVTPGAVSDEKAIATTSGGSQTVNRACAQSTNPFPYPLGTLLALGLACGGASTSESSSGAPTASATGQVTAVGVGSPSALPTAKVVPSSALATTLASVLGPLPTLPATGLPLALLAGLGAGGGPGPPQSTRGSRGRDLCPSPSSCRCSPGRCCSPAAAWCRWRRWAAVPPPMLATRPRWATSLPGPASGTSSVPPLVPNRTRQPPLPAP
ncbi:MAG: hypothetical protein ACRDYZ_14840 [Acidimicrobiales bacterium]